MGIATVRQGQPCGHRGQAADPDCIEGEATLQVPDPPLGGASFELVEVVPMQDWVGPLKETIDGSSDRLDSLDVAFDRPRLRDLTVGSGQRAAASRQCRRDEEKGRCGTLSGAACLPVPGRGRAVQ
jgi:hypothetical protein